MLAKGALVKMGGLMPRSVDLLDYGSIDNMWIPNQIWGSSAFLHTPSISLHILYISELVMDETYWLSARYMVCGVHRFYVCGLSKNG